MQQFFSAATSDKATTHQGCCYTLNYKKSLATQSQNRVLPDIERLCDWRQFVSLNHSIKDDRMENSIDIGTICVSAEGELGGIPAGAPPPTPH